MSSLRKRALVTGSANGLGRCIVNSLRAFGIDVIEFDIETNPDHDVTDSEKVAAFFSELQSPIDILVNNAALNGIDWLENFPEKKFDDIMAVNVKGIFNMTRAALPMLTQTEGTICNIVSNAARNPMRCSAAYNASKGAALMLTRQNARELIDQGITVFSVSPNKLSDTKMTEMIDRSVESTRGWSAEEAMEYQLNGLITGKETDPRTVAEFVAFLLSTKDRHRYLAGCDLQYGL